nr:complex I assembly factor TIMMDC1, mitochondrial [Meriones unguiculatus]
MEAPPPAPRSLLCRAWGPFPRVFAAGAVAVDPPGFVEDRDLHSNVSEPGSPESGWDRLRQLFVKDEQQRISKEVDYICRAAVSAGIIGWAYGGIPAFIYARKQYVKQSQAEIYHNRFDAVHFHKFLFLSKKILSDPIRDTLSTHGATASPADFLLCFRQSHKDAVTGGLFRVNLGVRGLVAGGIIGALLGTPMGSLLMALQKYAGETVQERRQKDRKAFHEKELEEWKSKLQFTEFLPEEIESGLEKIRPEEDAQRIEELLSLPRNPLSPDKQSED